MRDEINNKEQPERGKLMEGRKVRKRNEMKSEVENERRGIRLWREEKEEEEEGMREALGQTECEARRK